MASLSLLETVILLSLSLLILSALLHTLSLSSSDKTLRLPDFSSLVARLRSWSFGLGFGGGKKRPLVEGLDDPDPLEDFDLSTATTRNHLYVNKVRSPTEEAE